MSDTRTIHDPFIGKNVQISNRLTDRLRGRYACGPQTESGPEFGWREFETVPIQHEAAAEIDRLLVEVATLQTELNYFKTEYQDEAGMSMMREQQGFLHAEIARQHDMIIAQQDHVRTARAAALEEAAKIAEDSSVNHVQCGHDPGYMDGRLDAAACIRALARR